MNRIFTLWKDFVVSVLVSPTLNAYKNLVFGILVVCILAQPVHMNAATGKTMTLEEAIQRISIRYDVYFTYNKTLVQDFTVDYDEFDDQTLEEAMEQVLAGTMLRYRIHEDKYVIIYKRNQEGIRSLKSMARHLDDLIVSEEKREQSKRNAIPKLVANEMPSNIRLEKLRMVLNVSGTVTDQAGDPLIGVNVLVKGTNKGTATDFEGRFTLKDVDENAVLVLSYIGYQTKEVPVDGNSNLSISMLSDSQLIDEVVVVGYGTQKKENLTGAVTSISADELDETPLPNVGEVLRGVSPNLNINLSNYGGEPGAKRSWNIRGMGSINGNDSPLILVDGVEMDINNLDPGNIESVSILKDASASAIYGARAPFGVVLITTKKGKKGEPVRIQYSNNISFGSMLGVAHMENSLTYATAYNQASENAGSPPLYNESYLNRIKDYLDGNFQYEYDPDNPPNSIWAGRRVGNANYDWPYELMKNFKVDQKHNVSVSGGGDNTQYYISMGYYDENGFYSVGYDDYKRYDILANFKSQLTDWLSFDFSTKYANTNTDYPLGITTVERRYFFQNLYLFSPLTPKYNNNGSLANPMFRSIQGSGRDKSGIGDALFSLKTEIEPIKGWKTRVSFNYNVTQNNNTVNPKPIPVELATGGFGNVGKPAAAYETVFSKSPYTLFNAVSTYEKELGSHYFKVLGGYEQEEKSYTWLYARGDDLITEEIPSLSTSLGVKTVDDRKWEWATQGVFGRVNYNYGEKYLFEISARYNGSSRFSKDSRWGFFPSGSVGYRISRENFWKPIETVIPRLKLRFSYGELGNQNVANYLYIPSVPVHIETPWILSGERPAYAEAPGLISSDLTWETITTANFGFDAGFINDKLQLTFDWYNRRTSDMFGPQETLPYTLGTGTPRSNNAALETRGYEIILNWRDDLSNNFSYNAQLSFGDNTSKIVDFVNKEGLLSSWYSGKNVGEIWGLVTEGIIQTEAEAESMPDQSAIYPNWGPGDIRYKDLNGDGKITYGAGTLDDHGDQKIIGNSSPRYNIGVSGGVKWKNFHFNMHWLGLGKHDYFPDRSNVTFWGLRNSWAASAVLKDAPVLDYWRPADETNMFGPNTDSYLPKPYFSRETFKNIDVTQTRYLLNAWYLRLKFVQLGYTIPRNVVQNVFIQNARIYISGTNLLTIKEIPKTIDPEQTIGAGYTNTGAYYPLSKSFSVGLNITF